MSSIEKKWEDSTNGWSKIERLNFDGDRFWEECTITIFGENAFFPLGAAQIFEVYLDGKKICDEGIKGTKVFKRKINSNKGFNVTGMMSSKVKPKRVTGSVTVKCTYRASSILKSKSVTWKDGGGVTIIENLFLDAEETWKRCEVLIEGKQNTPNRFRVQLIRDGILAEAKPKGDQLNGTESRLYSYEINGKETLLVCGYFQLGGAKVTLTGYY